SEPLFQQTQLVVLVLFVLSSGSSPSGDFGSTREGGVSEVTDAYFAKCVTWSTGAHANHSAHLPLPARNVSYFETRALPTFARCYPCSFTFYVANPIAPFYFLPPTLNLSRFTD